MITHYHYAENGKVDGAWVYRNGNLIEFLRDRNSDGAWDLWIYYNKYGQVDRSEYDNNFDGKPDEWWTYSNGDLVTMEKDTDFNGMPDWFCRYKDDVLQETEMKPNGANFTTVREIYQNGVLTEIDRGGDSNGNFKEKVRYDPFFNPIGANPINTNIPGPFQLLSPASK
jgi:antitoxin component YwqK of YwqJK toxin-antitoxin module